jgi:hippurate hydrolase
VTALAEVEVLAAAAGLYRDLHNRPELSGAERRTARVLAGWLDAGGLEVSTGVGGHGVVGVLRNGDGPTVLLRAELDALPLRESTGLPYASTVTAPGPDGEPLPVMHACGHDLHVAALAAAASRLSASRGSWRGTLLVVGQPAEETLTGARAMLDDGLYDRFGRPDVVLAQHVAPMPAGMVAHGAGPMLAASATLRVTLHGRGGHAGTPHQTVDPVVAAAATVLRLQTVVSRETAPADQVVVTVGSLHAGTRGNVVPDRAVLEVTVRSLSDAGLERALASVHRIVHAEAVASGCPVPPDLVQLSRSPAVVPEPAAAGLVRRRHEELLGAVRVAGWPASMAAEDVGHLAAPATGRPDDRVPLVYWMLGCVGPAQWRDLPGRGAAEKLAAAPPVHSAAFAPALEPTLATGVSALEAAALCWLSGRAPRTER